MTCCISSSLGRPVLFSRSRNRGPHTTPRFTLYFFFLASRSRYIGQLFLVRATLMSHDDLPLPVSRAPAACSRVCHAFHQQVDLPHGATGSRFPISGGRVNRAWMQRRAQREALDCPDELQWTQQAGRLARSETLPCSAVQRKRSGQTEKGKRKKRSTH